MPNYDLTLILGIWWDLVNKGQPVPLPYGRVYRVVSAPSVQFSNVMEYYITEIEKR